MRHVDITGERYGRWTVVRFDHRDRYTWFWCRCDCGTERAVRSNNLRRGHATSCGCLRAERSREKAVRPGVSRKPHGMKGHPLYRTWKSMRNRCNNARDPKYVYYGGRGITIDQRWDYFPTFVADMGERPEGMTLDRVDNDGPYSPENCRWATKSEQMLNRCPMGTALLRTVTT